VLNKAYKSEALDLFCTIIKHRTFKCTVMVRIVGFYITL